VWKAILLAVWNSIAEMFSARGVVEDVSRSNFKIAAHLEETNSLLKVLISEVQKSNNVTLRLHSGWGMPCPGCGVQIGFGVPKCPFCSSEIPKETL